MTEAQALALRFKADWEIWSNPMPSKALQAYEAEFRENISRSCPDDDTLLALPCYPGKLALYGTGEMRCAGEVGR